MRTAPAAGPALLLLISCAVAPALRPIPAGAMLALIAAGVAWRGARGCAVAAVAMGLMLGELRRADDLAAFAGRAVEVDGRVCSAWRRHAASGGRSARLCARWLRIGERVSTEPPPLWLDLADGVATAPQIGERIVTRGTLARFAGFANQDSAAPGPWRVRVKSQALIRTLGRSPPWSRLHAAIRARIEAALATARVEGRPGVALARALVLGDESGLPEARRRALRRAGLAHLFAVSGFNLTLVAVGAAIVASAGGRGGRIALPATAIVTYLAAVGPEPSILRAWTMASLALGVHLLKRWSDPLQTLALAGAALVGSEPVMVEDVGFRLSMGATAGLLLAAARWRATFDGLPRPVATAVAATVAAQAGALPFAVAAFSETAPLATLWNLLAAPWAALWLLAGVLWFGLLTAWPIAAAVLAPALEPGAWPFQLLDRLPASPFVSLVFPGGLAAGLVAAALVVGLCESRRARRLAPLALAAVPWLGAEASPRQAGEVAFLDVGQGDAAFVRAGDFTALVDGGGFVGRDLGATVLRPALARRGVHRLDAAIVSHSDRDHCQGLLDLAALVPIAEVWSSPSQLRRGCGAQLVAASGGRARELVAGARLEAGGALFEVWHPSSLPSGERGNAESLVLALRLAGRRFVFTGDIGEAEERSAVAWMDGPRIDVLKVAHHGSAASTGRAWLGHLKPRWAVVSSGAGNSYGHPARATLERLRQAGARVLRTDRDGEIVWTLAGGRRWTLALPGAPRAAMPPR